MEGDFDRVLSSPEYIAIDSRVAYRLFHGESAMGRSIKLDDDLSLTVAAVFKPLPSNTHLAISAIVPMSLRIQRQGEAALDSWMANDYYTYLRIPDRHHVGEIESAVSDHLSGILRDFSSQVRLNFELQAMLDIHLHSNLEAEIRGNGSANTIALLSILAVLIIVLSLFNYTLSSAALTADRGREIGIRKAVGASDRRLARQFFVEALLILGFCLTLSILMLPALIAYLSSITGLELSADAVWRMQWIVSIVIAAAILIPATAALPAVLAAKAQPADTLRGESLLAERGRGGRNISLFLQLGIISAIAITAAHLYVHGLSLQARETGYQTEGVYLVDNIEQRDMDGYLASLGQALGKESAISAVSAAEFPPPRASSNFASLRLQDQPERRLDNVRYNNVYRGYFEILSVPILSGEGFDESHQLNRWPSVRRSEGREVLAIVLNRAAVEALGLSPFQAIDQYIEMNGVAGMDLVGQIIGVSEDYIQSEVAAGTRPEVYLSGLPIQAEVRLLVAGASGSSEESVQTALQRLWPQETGRDFRYPWLSMSEARQALFQDERRRFGIFGLAVGFGVILLTMALVANFKFLAERHLFELAMRRVLGAGMGNLALVLSRQLMWTIVIALLLGALLAVFWIPRILGDDPAWAGQHFSIYVLCIGLMVGLIALVVSSTVRTSLSRNLGELIRRERL